MVEAIMYLRPQLKLRPTLLAGPGRVLDDGEQAGGTAARTLAACLPVLRAPDVKRDRLFSGGEGIEYRTGMTCSMAVGNLTQRLDVTATEAAR